MKTPKETGSISQCISDLKGDDLDAVVQAQQKVWNHYFSRLASLARSRMPGDARRAADGEDVALSVLDSFYRRAGDGEFPNLKDRTGLWPLLARITKFKAIQRVEHERAAKRGGSKVIHESDFPPSGDESLPSLEQIISSEPTPELALQMAEQVEHLMKTLADETLVQIAQLKLEGYQNTEIAQRLGVGLRTIERKLARIRTLWVEEI